MRTKYPRTYHLPFSPGASSDDKVLRSLEHFTGKEVVITEKFDGENCSIYPDYVHARSIDGRHHPSRDWVKQFQAEIGYKIPAGWRICGENVFAKHSIGYDTLPSYFLGFSVWDEHNCALSWDDSIMWFDELGVSYVREMYRGVFDERHILQLAAGIDTSKQEGFVVRLAESFHYDDFSKSVAKWVRPCHVQSEEHWMFSAVVPNHLEK